MADGTEVTPPESQSLAAHNRKRQKRRGKAGKREDGKKVIIGKFGSISIVKGPPSATASGDGSEKMPFDDNDMSGKKKNE